MFWGYMKSSDIRKLVKINGILKRKNINYIADIPPIYITESETF